MYTKRMDDGMKWTGAAVAMLAVGSLSSAVQASTVGYWRAENSTTSEVDSPALDYTGGSTAGFSTDVAGAFVFDPVAATSVSNVGSYDHGGAGTVSTASSNAAVDAAIDGGAFTVEAFVKLNEGGNFSFDAILENVDGTTGWSFGFDVGGKPQFFNRSAAGTNFGTPVASAALSTGVWHHIAAVGTLTDQSGSSLPNFTEIQIYVDYVASGDSKKVEGAVVDGPVVKPNTNDYEIGGTQPFADGLIDELRISSESLAPEDFLQIVPEPASLVLMGFGGLLMLRGRVRK